MRSVIQFYKETLTVAGVSYVAGKDFNLEEDRRFLIERLSQSEINILNHYKAKVLVSNDPAMGCAATAWVSEGQALVNYNVAVLRGMEASGGDIADVLVEVTHHECQHLQQMLSGRLCITPDNTIIYEGVEYQPVVPGITKEYLEQPWEKEAMIVGYEALINQGRCEPTDNIWEEIYVPMVGDNTQAA